MKFCNRNVVVINH